MLEQLQYQVWHISHPPEFPTTSDGVHPGERVRTCAAPGPGLGTKRTKQIEAKRPAMDLREIDLREICWRPARDVQEICWTSARDQRKSCWKYAREPLEICNRAARDLLGTRDLREIYKNTARDQQQICKKSAKDLLEIYEKTTCLDSTRPESLTAGRTFISF